MVELNSTNGIPVTVNTNPGGFSGTPDISTTPSDVAVHTIVKLVLGQRASELFGGETLKYSFDNDKPIQSLTYTNDFITITLLYVAEVFETILENGEKTIDLATKEKTLSAGLQCFQDTKGLADLKDPSRIAEADGVILKGISTCISVLPGAGAAWSLIVMLPQVAINYASLIGDEILGAKTQTIVIKQIARPITKVSAGAYALTEKDLNDNWQNFSFGHTPAAGFDSPDHFIQCYIANGEDSSRYSCTIPASRNLSGTTKCASTSQVGGVVGFVGSKEVDIECTDQPIVPNFWEGGTPGLPGTSNKVLPVGSIISLDGATCSITAADGYTMKCYDDSTKAGFTISRKTYTFQNATGLR